MTPKSLDLLAFDLGAESGRAMLGRFDGGRLRLSEVHRFPNVPLRLADGLHWDPDRLFEEIKRGLSLCRARYGQPASAGIDTWGVDCALLGDDGEPLFPPFHYRDRRTDGVMAEAFKRVPRAEVFECTGLQFLPFNTLFQLYSMVLAGSPLLRKTRTFLTMPDLFNYRLTGRAVCEFTNATTTQLFEPRARVWALPLLERLDIPTEMLPPIVPAGTVLGQLLPGVAAATGMDGLTVVAPACHDTGSAVAAVPAGSGRYGYISSGTWSLVGVEIDEPLITPECLAANFTNEGGATGNFRLLKNVAGMWLLQECRRVWVGEGDDLSYADLAALAAAAPPFGALIDVNDPSFLSPPDMPAAIAAFCRSTGQRPPADKAAIVRCVLESLALKYRFVFGQLEAMLRDAVEVIHIVGGGSQNGLLCQLTADATGRPVLAGPVEATAAGNVIVQAMALGHVASLGEAREVVRRSFEIVAFEPRDRAPWDEAYARFLEMLERRPDPV